MQENAVVPIPLIPEACLRKIWRNWADHAQREKIRFLGCLLKAADSFVEKWFRMLCLFADQDALSSLMMTSLFQDGFKAQRSNRKELDWACREAVDVSRWPAWMATSVFLSLRLSALWVSSKCIYGYMWTACIVHHHTYIMRRERPDFSHVSFA